MRDYIVDNLRRMVSIHSVSGEDMDEIIEFTSGLLKDIGLETRVVKGDDHAPVIMASHKEKGVCFSGHLDTVPIDDGWTKEHGEIVNGNIYGRGALDMKGPCVSMIAAAKKMVEEDIPFSLIFTTDEEVSMAGAEEVSSEREVTDAPAVVICEPTALLVVTKEKGVYQFEISTEGKNAHASMPEQGDNAVTKMLPILMKIGSKGNIPAGDKLSCCVNVVEGGSATNVIPKLCRAEIDVRFPPKYDEASLMEYLFNDVSEDFKLKTIQYLDPVSIDEKKRCVQTMLDIADTDTWSVPYGTEMVMFSKTNENTFIFGPGAVDSAHKPDEYIELKQLVDIVDIYVEYARAMHGQ